jgi:large subunit ribosomal protein L29
MAKEKTSTKIADLRAKSDDQLKSQIAELLKEQFNLRIQKATGQLTNVARVGQVRREIAQIKTLMNEKAKGIKQQKPKAKKAA